MIFSNIILSIDIFSSYELLLEQSLQLANDYEATLHITYVVSETLLSLPYVLNKPYMSDELDLKQKAKIKLEEIKSTLKSPRIRTHLLSGNPKSKLMSLARKFAADLIIMGVNKDEPSGLLRESPTKQLISATKTPLLLIPTTQVNFPLSSHTRILLLNFIKNHQNLKIGFVAVELVKKYESDLYVLNLLDDKDISADVLLGHDNIFVEKEVPYDRIKTITNFNLDEVRAYAESINADLILAGVPHNNRLWFNKAKKNFLKELLYQVNIPVWLA